jgi:hypothetical protein
MKLLLKKKKKQEANAIGEYNSNPTRVAPNLVQEVVICVHLSGE